jgi:protoporphyrinogen/coproporphyrinogen III oxidase
MACTFAHRKFAGRAPKGFVLLRVFLSPSAELRSEATVVKNVLGTLKHYLGVGQPMFYDFRQWFRAMPQYAVGHLTDVAQIEEESLRLPGLFLAGNWLRGVGVPDCIESGERAAEGMFEYLQKRLS